jgi:hypothetical protein
MGMKVSPYRHSIKERFIINKIIGPRNKRKSGHPSNQSPTDLTILIASDVERLGQDGRNK